MHRIEELESRTLLNATLTSTSVDGPVDTEATIGKGAARLVRFTDPNGVAGAATLNGQGIATLTFTGAGVTASTSKAGVETVTGIPQSISIATTGTSIASNIRITGAVSLAAITTDANIGSVAASRASLTGDLSITGTAGTINLATANSGTISVSAAGKSLQLKIGLASGETVNSAESIGSISAASWLSGGAITAPTISHIAVSKELNAEITATNVGQVVAGSITSSAWSMSGKLSGISAASITALNLSAGDIGPITDRGAANNDAIETSGNIGTIHALSMAGTLIEAGVSTLDAYNLATDFSANDKITSVTIGKGGFSNSVIDAETLNQVSLGAFSSNNGGIPFGVAASDILSFVGTVDGKRLSLTHVVSATQVAVALRIADISPNDLAIRIV